jgi:hypothetical protein
MGAKFNLWSIVSAPWWFIFRPKNRHLGKFCRALDWKMLIHFMAIWNILQTFGIFYNQLVHFLLNWYIISGFGIMLKEKSGNPDSSVFWNSSQNGGRIFFILLYGRFPVGRMCKKFPNHLTPNKFEKLYDIHFLIRLLICILHGLTCQINHCSGSEHVFPSFHSLFLSHITYAHNYILHITYIITY